MNDELLTLKAPNDAAARAKLIGQDLADFRNRERHYDGYVLPVQPPVHEQGTKSNAGEWWLLLGVVFFVVVLVA